jgi:YebC/PmpR family DNA-binding regulatory protein
MGVERSILMSGHSKWANIKHRKGKADAIKGKLTTKISREITIAVKMGGADPIGNTRLKLALQKARANNVPKENIQRAVQKGQGALDGSDYEEITYEGYGAAGVAVIVTALTDNRNRTAAEIRHLFSKYGGNLGETGCVGWMFKRRGLFVVERSVCAREEDLMLIALDAGADDLKTEAEAYEIIVRPEEFDQVEKALADNSIEVASAEIALLPDSYIAVGGADAERIEKMLEALEDLDDVQDVFSNADLPDVDGE